MKLERTVLWAEKDLFLEDGDPAIGFLGFLHGCFGENGLQTDENLPETVRAEYAEVLHFLCSPDARRILFGKVQMEGYCRNRRKSHVPMAFGRECWGFRILNENLAWYLACTPWNDRRQFSLFVYDRMTLMTALAARVGLPERCYGETVMAIELAPDGSGYRAKTRFAKFSNIPEMMAMFRQVADIQTADMLNLPVPKANYHIVKVPASEIQKQLVQSFAERAEKIHAGLVSSDRDNMLLITNDGRKAALDQRLINPMLPDEPESKVNACVRNVYAIWKRTEEKRSAQMIFCDLSIPKGDGKFNVYDDIREKLIAKGIPPEEIAFIHTADTDAKKKELFAKVRAGQVRVLMGSTFKMGAGTNCQTRLIALHDLDCPWRPSDLEQRAGRIVRQGNLNPEVDIYRYIAEGTFDAYMYQLMESKQRFTSQIMTSKSPVRSAEDVDETVLSYAELKAIASGNPKIIEKMQLDADVAKLRLRKASHLSVRYELEDDLRLTYPKKIAEAETYLAALETDLGTVAEHTEQTENGFSPMTIRGTVYTERKDAGEQILAVTKSMTNPEPKHLGTYRGMEMELGFDTVAREFFIRCRGQLTHTAQLGKDAGGIIQRIDNCLGGIGKRIALTQSELAGLHEQVENAKAQLAKPFPDEAELTEKSRRLDELNAELNMDQRENEIADGEMPQEETEQERDGMERNDR